MKLIVLIIALFSLAPASRAHTQGAQIPQPTINPIVKDALRNLAANLSVTALSPVLYGTPGRIPLCAGTTNTILVNVSNTGGTLFPAPVELSLTATNRTTKAIGAVYRSTIDGTTTFVSPPGAKIYVIYFRNVRVNASWAGGWEYTAKLRRTGSQGSTVMGNWMVIPVPSDLRSC